MLPVELIRCKRDGGRMPDADIRNFMRGVTDGSLPDYQVAALLMAVFFRGMSDDELATWADAMTQSGDVLDLSSIARAKIDKHSTGGVGDKISIPLAPAVAACGVAVPMVSGRGLGHSGGTLDKLESIPGFRVDLPVDQFAKLVGEIGTCLIGQTARIAPADKRLYALRDVTGTVESVPLIASSIMSKKLAEGIDGLVLDVKVGTGAFMKTLEAARALAKALTAIGRGAGKKITCVLTDMNAPIGRTIGNALEIRESIEVMRGGGPRDTKELTEVLGAEMLVLGGVAKDASSGRAQIAAALADGRALEVFRKVVAAQGGDPAVCDEPGRVLPRATQRTPVPLPKGFVHAMNAEGLGMAALVLGGGRAKKDDVIAPGAGIVVDTYVGEHIDDTDVPRMFLHHSFAADDPRVVDALRRAQAAVTIGPNPGDPGHSVESASRILEVLR